MELIRFFVLSLLSCTSIFTLIATNVSPVLPQVDPSTGKISQDIDSLLAVVLMVKDEESVMVRTLEPFVKAGVQSYLIFDTGSTDKTQEVTRTYFKAQKVQQSHILQEPFVDFATSRNRSLELAEEKFPHTEFFLVLDAEWYMHNVEELIEFCRKHAHISKQDASYSPAYLINVQHTGGQISYWSARLLRRSAKLRYEGEVHEVISQPVTHKIPASSYLEQSPEQAGDEKSQKRWHRDKEILLHSYQKNPTNPRTVFYLARTFDELAAISNKLEDLNNAYRYYKERVKLATGTEEDFIAMYCLALITEKKYMRQRSVNWLEALGYYQQAYSMRPWRAEPLVRIAQHYAQLGESGLAYVYALRAAQLPFPESDILWVEKEIYDFSRYTLLSQCAWLQKEYTVGEKAILKALEAQPNCLYLYRNLALYWERDKHSGSAA